MAGIFGWPLVVLRERPAPYSSLNNPSAGPLDTGSGIFRLCFPLEERHIWYSTRRPARGARAGYGRLSRGSSRSEGCGLSGTSRRGPVTRAASCDGLPEEVPVVAVGGDGTVHEVAAACAGTGRIMGVLPAGSGNDYVKALGVGTNLRRALEVLVEGKVRVVDTAEVNGVPVQQRARYRLRRRGRGRRRPGACVSRGDGKVPVVGRAVTQGFPVPRGQAHVSMAEVVEAKTILVAVALGTTYGSMFRLAPEAVLDDGLFDVIWSEEVNRAEVLRLIPAALRGHALRHRKVHTARAREVAVELAEEIPAHVDGEMLARTRQLPGAGAARVATCRGAIALRASLVSPAAAPPCQQVSKDLHMRKLTC